MKNLNERLIKLLNYRIEQEEYSSRLYKEMSIWLDYNGYFGAASLWKKYSNEEIKHAEWAYQFLLDLDYKPEVPALKKPECDCSSLIEVVQKSYKHEQDITEQCQNLAQEAFSAGDYMTLHLAQKYLDEQTEELAKLVYWLDRLEAFGTSQENLRLLDNEMKDAD